jgi:hypothetical protein
MMEIVVLTGMKRISQTILLAGILAAAGNASTVLTLNPESGAVSGEPGQAVGWGFTIQDSQFWVTVAGTDFCSSFNPNTDAFPCDSAHPVPHGTYFDFTSVPSNFVDSQPSSMGGPDTSQQNFVYNPPCNTAGPCTGTGVFTIDANTPINTPLRGVIVVDFNLWLGDPSNGGLQQGGDNFIVSNASVLVVPEPETLLLMGIALAGVGLLSRRAESSLSIRQIRRGAPRARHMPA